MKISLKELKKIIEDAAEEVIDAQPTGFKRDPKHDYSKPLGDTNRLKRQGASNMGPYTSESALKAFVKNTVTEAFARKKSVK